MRKMCQGAELLCGLGVSDASIPSASWNVFLFRESESGKEPQAEGMSYRVSSQQGPLRRLCRRGTESLAEGTWKWRRPVCREQERGNRQGHS